MTANYLGTIFCLIHFHCWDMGRRLFIAVMLRPCLKVCASLSGWETSEGNKKRGRESRSKNGECWRWWTKRKNNRAVKYERVLTIKLVAASSRRLSSAKTHRLKRLGRPRRITPKQKTIATSPTRAESRALYHPNSKLAHVASAFALYLILANFYPTLHFFCSPSFIPVNEYANSE